MPHGPFPMFFVFGTIVLIVVVFKLLKDRGQQSATDEYTDETRMIQEMYRSLSRMEERIEALETLLVEQEEKGSEK